MSRIVVVDDHPLLRAGLRSILAESEFDVVAEAADGEQAFSAIATHDPDIVLLDISMPAPDGIAVLEGLRAADDRRAIVLLTAAIGDDQLLRAIQAGANGIVMKDGAEDTLIDSLRAVAAGHTAVPRELLEHALSLSLGDGPARGALARLSPRERNIAECVSAGMRNREIAERVGVSEGTVKTYLYHIYNKLGIGNRTELAVFVRDQGTG